ncbi:MAG: biotin-dependent carboxyltransferase family protein [Limisphaerales bacterium]
MTEKKAKSLLEIVSPGMGMTVQDLGRIGWRRFGVPMSGAMDDHSLRIANQLVGNPPGTPGLEMLLQGQRIRVREDAWISVTGADSSSTIADWHAAKVHKGSEIVFPVNRSGVWIYLAVAGGVTAPSWFGSASVCPRAQIGSALQSGDQLFRATESSVQLPGAVAGRVAAWEEQRNFQKPPVFRVWPGPQRDWFSESELDRFFENSWKISSQSDRTGYRLEGEPISVPDRGLISEPVRIGSVQIPPNGQPIVTMRDGPTVGGYPKIGMLDPRDLSWLVQCRPGQDVQFTLT